MSNRQGYNLPVFKAVTIDGEVHPTALYPGGHQHFPLRDAYSITIEEDTQGKNNRGFEDTTLSGSGSTVKLLGNRTKSGFDDFVLDGDKVRIVQIQDGYAVSGSANVYTVNSVSYDGSANETTITFEETLADESTGANNAFTLLSEFSAMRRVETWECSLQLRTDQTNIEPSLQTYVYTNGFRYTLRGEETDRPDIHVTVDGPVLLKDVQISDDRASGISTVTLVYERRSETFRLNFEPFAFR